MGEKVNVAIWMQKISYLESDYKNSYRDEDIKQEDCPVEFRRTIIVHCLYSLYFAWSFNQYFAGLHK